MVGWYVNYHSVTRRMEARTAGSTSFEGALIHARALAINGHIVRNIVGPNGGAFEAKSFQDWRKEEDDAGPRTETGRR